MQVLICILRELMFSNNLPKRHTLRGWYSYTSSVATEFGFGMVSMLLQGIKCVPQELSLGSFQCVASFLPAVSVALTFSESKTNLAVCSVYLTEYHWGKNVLELHRWGESWPICEINDGGRVSVLYVCVCIHRWFFSTSGDAEANTTKLRPHAELTLAMVFLKRTDSLWMCRNAFILT